MNFEGIFILQKSNLIENSRCSGGIFQKTKIMVWFLLHICKGLEHFLIFSDEKCWSPKLIFDAICRGRTTLGFKHFCWEVHFECYLWCSRTFWNFSVCLGSSFLMLFVVAGHGLFFLVFLQKIILNAICRGRRYFWKAQLEVESVIFGILLWF